MLRRRPWRLATANPSVPPNEVPSISGSEYSTRIRRNGISGGWSYEGSVFPGRILSLLCATAAVCYTIWLTTTIVQHAQIIRSVGERISAPFLPEYAVFQFRAPRPGSEAAPGEGQASVAAMDRPAILTLRHGEVVAADAPMTGSGPSLASASVESAQIDAPVIGSEIIARLPLLPPPVEGPPLPSLPAYHADSGGFGFVLRDLARRILWGKMPPPLDRGGPAGDVLIAAGEGSALTRFSGHASSAGHRIHSVDAAGADLWEWWSSQSRRSPGGDGDNVGIGRIRLAAFEGPPGREDDALWSSSGSKFLREAQIDYVVLGLRANSTFMGGTHAAEALVAAGYKLMVLSVSHFVPDAKNGRTWRPNTHVEGRAGARGLLYWGVKGLKSEDEVFRTYLFGTKGLDLAIPSAREFLNTKSRDRDSGIIKIEGDEGVPYLRCPKRHAKVEIKFVSHDQVRGCILLVFLEARGEFVWAHKFFGVAASIYFLLSHHFWM